MSAFTEIAALVPLKIWGGVVGRIVDGERVTLAVVELDPDSVIPEHRHENEQVGMLVAGSLSFRVEDEMRDLGPGGTWRILANTPHEVRTGPEGAVVIEAFAPPREDWQKLERHATTAPRWPEQR